ncbi:phosphoenolpyruvate--protein phosphotransferase [Vibrio caribbeanicus]|uniref:phosphoenolpyruvate--protein phosphotransferase n=1 Tax=Vibrio caribbeanicus TaxID=701175 RepID=UPI0030DB3402
MLSQLREIVEQVSKVYEVHQALDILVSETCSAMNVDCCTVYLANDEKQRLELMATKGLKFHQEEIHINFGEGLVGLVKRIEEPLNLAEASKHPNFKFFSQLGEDIYQSFLGTPIIYRKKVLGVLVVQQKSPRLFSEMEESFLVTLSAQIAVIIAHAQTQGNWLLEKNHSALHGIPASSGVAIGDLWWDDTHPSLDDVCPASTLDIVQEQEWLLLALEDALNDFRRLRKKLDSEINKEALAIFDLFTHLLNDPMLRKDLKSKIQKGNRADWALRQVIESYSNRFASMSDVYLRERAQDLRELGQRLLFFLHNSEPSQQTFNQPVILVVRELSASLLATLPKDKILAVIALEGAANSHAAILARALGIPTVLDIKLNLDDVNGQKAIVDGYSGKVIVCPSQQLLNEYQELLKEEIELADKVQKGLGEPTLTKDKKRIEVMLNSGLSSDNNTSINQSVDGVGLYRTEISFLLIHRFPSEEEQVQQYQTVLERYPSKQVVMRTLDVGGDKPLPYLPIEEDNPFLGWRGIRFTLDHPDIFLMQVRAMMRASSGHENLSILLPMISGSQELDDAIALIKRAFSEVRQLDGNIKMPKIGIMVEVPSMVYLLPFVADKIDFVSVGSNDLTQYLLAVDRNNSRVSDVYELMHPSVIMALNHIRALCEQLKLPVCICGEIAGDPMGALLMVGLGYRSLSMNTSNVAKIKYLLRHTETQELESLAAKALKKPYGKDIDRMMRTFLEQKGFAGFIRAGNK